MSLLSEQMIQYWRDSGILDSYSFQYGLWEEENIQPGVRYFVIKESAGATSNQRLRQPNYTLYLISKENEGFKGQAGMVGEAAEDMIQFMIDNPSYENFILIKELSQPIGPGKTTGNRYWYEFTVRTITCGEV